MCVIFEFTTARAIYQRQSVIALDLQHRYPLLVKIQVAAVCGGGHSSGRRRQSRMLLDRFPALLYSENMIWCFTACLISL